MRSKRGSSTQTMCYVVAYDIPDDRRRTKVHQILMGFTEDSVRFYPLCANCVAKVETIGGPLPQDELLFIV